MRNGIILSFNKIAGIGVIKDANNQHILFYHNSKSVTPVRLSKVTFEIQFQNGSLIAVSVKFSSVKVLCDNMMLTE